MTKKRAGRENGRARLENGSPGLKNTFRDIDSSIPGVTANCGGAKKSDRASPASPGRAFRHALGPFRASVRADETIAHDLKARWDRSRMFRGRFARMASRSKTISHHLNPIDEHMRAPRRRFTPRAAQAISTADHF